jgi:hypothetical protein
VSYTGRVSFPHTNESLYWTKKILHWKCFF